MSVLEKIGTTLFALLVFIGVGCAFMLVAALTAIGLASFVMWSVSPVQLLNGDLLIMMLRVGSVMGLIFFAGFAIDKEGLRAAFEKDEA